MISARNGIHNLVRPDRRPQIAIAAWPPVARRWTVSDVDHTDNLWRRGDMIAAGRTRSEIDRRCDTGAWQAPYRGVLLTNTAPVNFSTQVAAAVATQPPGRAHASHDTAALWRLDAPRSSTCTDLHVTVPRDAVTRHRPGLRLHRALLDAEDQAEVEVIAVTSAAPTVLDLARTRGRWASVVAADSALRRKLCSPDDLDRALERITGLRGVVPARVVVEDSEPRSRSAGESRLRLTLVDGGLPRPRAGYLLFNDFGDPIAEGDLVYDERLVWLEYDGFSVHTERATFRNDRGRERMLRARGWEVIRFVDSDLDIARGVMADAAAH